MKKLKWIILAVVLLVIIGLGVVWFSLDEIVRKAVETQASSSLNLQTTLGGLNLSILNGSLSMRDLEIASPSGFAAPKMLTLGGANVQVSLGDLRGQPVRIADIELQKPVLTLEQANGKLNLQALSEGSSKTPAAPPSGGASTGEPTRVIIDHLRMTDAQVIIRPGLPGLNSELTIPVGTLDLKNIGNGDGSQNGAAVGQVAMSVMGAMAASAGNSPLIPPELKALLKLDVGQFAKSLGGDLQNQLGNIGNLGQNLGKDLGNVVKTGDLPDAGKNIGKDLGNGIGGLLGGGKKDNKNGN